MSLFKLEQVQKFYAMGPETVRALDGVDLEIHSGDYLAILGASGSGKSTLMNLLGFMETATGGKIFFEGEDVSDINANRRAAFRSSSIGFVFQSFNLLPRLSVLENVLLPLSYGDQRNSLAVRKEQAQEALEKIGMEHRIKHLPSQLSGGERQRVAIARALANQPRLILADEPTGNLDSANVSKVMAIFDQLNAQGHTIVLVTHDIQVASFAKRILNMQDGRLKESGCN